MIIVDVVQGTPEWFTARCGIPTASNFDKIITVDGKPSKQRQKYLYQLAGERVAGAKAWTYVNEAMQRGVELEAEARQLFEMVTGEEVTQVGMCMPSEKSWACSPDGLIGKDSGLEIKCPLIHTHVEYLLESSLPSDYFQQVQGNMMITGRASWNFMSYYPGLRPLILVVKRDDKFCMALLDELAKFTKELWTISEKIA